MIDSRPAVAPWRLKVVGLVLITFAVAFLITSVGLIYLNFRDAAIVSAYHNSTACASPSDALTGDRCRYTGPATVVRSERQNLLSLDLRFDGLTDRTFRVMFPKDGEPAGSQVSPGAQAQGELWNGQVVRFAGAAVSGNPDAQPSNLLFGGIFFAVGFALFLYWGLQSARRGWGK